MLSTLSVQPSKEPKIDMLSEERAINIASDITKCIAETQYLDPDKKETTAQIFAKFISKSEFGGIENLINEICASRITAAIEERDDMWRQHESTQISFLQNENSKMLTGLHVEIERLHHHLRDLYHRLYVKKSFENNAMLKNENEQLRKSLEKAEQNMEKLNQELKRCEEKSKELKQETTETIKALRNQLAYQGNKIRQLTDELHERSAQITKLMAQLPLGILAETTENDVPARLHFQSAPTIHWNPAPAAFFGKKNNDLPYASLMRNASIIYPGGRPNVVAQKYSYTSSTPRSHHLPQLCAKARSEPSSERNIEKPSQLKMLNLHDRMLLTRSLYEIRNVLNFYTTASSKSMNINESMQNTI